jgi:hypothetical protein
VGFFEEHFRAHGREWAASPLPGVRGAVSPHLGEHSVAYLSPLNSRATAT